MKTLIENYNRLAMFQIHDILQCPSCLGRVDADLRCLSCRTKYESKKEIPVMVSPMVSMCHSCWDIADFASGRLESKMATYLRFLNSETKIARELWIEAMMKRIGYMSGLAADVASGLYPLGQRMLERSRTVIPVSTDIDPRLLDWKRSMTRVPPGREHLWVASDAMHFAFADGTFDYIANADGLINMGETDLFLSEMFRALKPGGRLVIMHRLFSQDTRTYGLARVYGIHRTLEAGPLREMIKRAGFTDVTVEEVSRAVWAENPGQTFPVPGDLQTFAIVEAVK